MIFNVSVCVAFYFVTRLIAKLFEMVPISINTAGVVLGIMTGTMLLIFLYNSLIKSLKLDRKIIE